MSVQENSGSSHLPPSSSRSERSGNCISRAILVITDNPRTSTGISITAFVVVLLLAISATGGCGVIGHLTGSSLLQALTNTLSLTSFITITGGSGGAAVFLSFLSLIVFLCKRDSMPTRIPTTIDRSLVNVYRRNFIMLESMNALEMSNIPPTGEYAIYSFRLFGPRQQFYVFSLDTQISCATAEDAVREALKVFPGKKPWTPKKSEALGEEKKTRESDREAIRSKIIPLFGDAELPLPPEGYYVIYHTGYFYVVCALAGIEQDKTFDNEENAIDFALNLGDGENLQQWTPDPDEYVSWFDGKFIQLEDQSMVHETNQPPVGEYAIYHFAEFDPSEQYLVCSEKNWILCATAWEAVAHLIKLNGGKEPWTPKLSSGGEFGARRSFSSDSYEDESSDWNVFDESLRWELDREKAMPQSFGLKIIVADREDRKLFAAIPEGQFAIFRFKEYEPGKQFAVKYTPKSGLKSKPKFFSTKDEAINCAAFDENFVGCKQWTCQGTTTIEEAKPLD